MVLNLRWLGHAAFQIKTLEKIIYIDLEARSEPTEKADVILATHSHLDHCDPQMIKKIRKPNTMIIAPPECVSKIDGEIRVINPGDTIEINNITVKAVDAYNYKRFRSPGQPFHPKGKGVGYILKIEGKTIYHAGDTDFIPEMKNLGVIDLALLPSGGTYTMDNKDAVDATLAIKPKFVIPMHRWETKSEEFQRKVEANSKIKVLLIKKGEEIQV